MQLIKTLKTTVVEGRAEVRVDRTQQRLFAAGLIVIIACVLGVLHIQGTLGGLDAFGFYMLLLMTVVPAVVAALHYSRGDLLVAGGSFPTLTYVRSMAGLTWSRRDWDVGEIENLSIVGVAGVVPAPRPLVSWKGIGEALASMLTRGLASAPPEMIETEFGAIVVCTSYGEETLMVAIEMEEATQAARALAEAIGCPLRALPSEEV